MRITQEALQKLMRYPFPGNVRELENLIEGSLALTTDPVIDPGDLALPESASGAGGVELLTDFPSLERVGARAMSPASSPIRKATSRKRRRSWASTARRSIGCERHCPKSPNCGFLGHSLVSALITNDFTVEKV